MFVTAKQQKIGTSGLEQISWPRFETVLYLTDLAGKSGGTYILNMALHALVDKPCVECSLQYVDSPAAVQKSRGPTFPWQLNFVWWCPIFVDPFCMSLLALRILTWLLIFGKCMHFRLSMLCAVSVGFADGR